MTNSFNPGNAIRADALNENFEEIKLQLQELEGSITNPSGTMKGPQGDRGIQGPAGPTGAAGAQGAQGPQGTQGTTGTQGVKGERGPQGEQGPQGQAGPSGPQGVAGPKGDEGTGLRLLGTYAYTGAPNNTTAPNPTQGDLWKASDNNCWAYSGTAWMNVGTLAGATGATGATGAAGAQGTTGAAGAAGAAGVAGATGPTGAQGPAGPAGAKGDTGAIGATGPQGLQGATGLQGPSGVATTMGTLTDVVLASPGALDKLEYNGVNWVNVPKSDSEIIYNTVANKNAIPNFVVNSISLTAAGTGYSSAPTVTITNSSGSSGSGATATATINAGAVTGVTVTAAGSGYSAGATVAFSGGGGTGATAVAVTNPTNGTGVEVTDSTGIESFTPMSGMPSGFVGDSGLTVRLQYTTTGSSSWKWKRYFASTSETRYASIAGETFTGAVNLDEHVTVKNGKEVRVSEETANGSSYIALKAPTSLPGNVTWELPTGGNANEILKTDGNGVLSFATASSLTQSGITELLEDTTPELGGDLSVNNKSIISPTGNANINITPHGTGNVVLSGLEFPNSDGSANQILKTNGSNVLSWVTPTDTTYSVGDGGLTQNNFTDADHSKLNAIEASATADQTDAEIKTAYENNSDTNAYTDTEKTKLSGIATSANNYTHPNHSGEVTSTADGATVITDNTVDEANLKISNAPTNGQFLSAQSGNTGGLTWATPTDTDTTYTAGSGLTLSGTQFSVNAVALTTVQEAANESAQLALTAQEGDVVVRTDENKSYVHNGGTANSMADYTLLRTPTDAVLSVNGNTGAITAAQIATAVEAASDSNTFTDADHTKLNAIEASATADQTNAEIRTAVEAASDSNVFTDADHTKLNAIEASATADQTGAEIKTAYEAESDTNAYTDAEKTKLSGIATSANNYSHPTSAGNVHVPTGGSSGQFLKYSSSGTAVWAADNNTTYSVGDGGLTQNNFTDADHSKLDGIAASANNYSHPNHSGEVTSTADGATVIADDTVDEANLKISNAGSNGQYLQKQSGNTGGLTWADVSSTPTDITVADESSDTSCNVAFFTAATGDLAPKTGTNLTFNSSTGELTATKLTDDLGDVRSIPKLSKSSNYTPVAADAGKCIFITAAANVQIDAAVFSAGDALTIINTHSAAININPNSITLYNTANGSTGMRALASRGMATIWFAETGSGASDTAYISGGGLT